MRIEIPHERIQVIIYNKLYSFILSHIPPAEGPGLASIRQNKISQLQWSGIGVACNSQTIKEISGNSQDPGVKRIYHTKQIWIRDLLGNYIHCCLYKKNAQELKSTQEFNQFWICSKGEIKILKMTFFCSSHDTSQDK